MTKMLPGVAMILASLVVMSEPALAAPLLGDVLHNKTDTGPTTSSNPAAPGTPEKPATPATNMPIIPEAPVAVPAGQQQQVTIPALPPSLTCKQEWLYGVWELQHIYESPLGAETENYYANPFQYISFDKDSRFFRLNAGRTQMIPQEAQKQMTEHSTALLQYILQDAGMLYLYQDRVATETMVCFVVAETKPPYAAGNLLLMPPKGQINGRLIKVYKKVWPKNQNVNKQKPSRRGRQRPPSVNGLNPEGSPN